MNAKTENNENWGKCPKCGEPVLKDPETGTLEPCAACASHESQRVGAMGAVLLVAGVAALVGLVYLCVKVLL